MVRNTSSSILLSVCILIILSACLASGSKPGSAGKKQDTELWPPIQPFTSGFLQVSELHEIYYEESGNPKGKPVFVVHGGPGGGTKPVMRRFFNPKKFRMIMFDQRGCGKSRPNAEISENTTMDLVSDMEKLREHLDLERVFLFGGSWGSTLSLVYAETYPKRVSGMLLRGIWTGTKDEINHFYHGGAAAFFPDAYKRLQQSLPEPGKRPLPEYLVKLLQSQDEKIRSKTANEWVRYESKISGINVTDESIEQALAQSDSYAFALLENHYMANDCFIQEGQILQYSDRLKELPITIVNGRFDMCCPPGTAFLLSQKLPLSKLVIVEDGGHGGWPVMKVVVDEMREFE